MAVLATKWQGRTALSPARAAACATAAADGVLGGAVPLAPVSHTSVLFAPQGRHGRSGAAATMARSLARPSSTAALSAGLPAAPKPSRRSAWAGMQGRRRRGLRGRESAGAAIAAGGEGGA